MTPVLTPVQQRSLQAALYDLSELADELMAVGQSLVVITHPPSASDRFTAMVYGETGPALQTFTWQAP